ncbi:MAG: acid phosphatase [Sphingomonadales bacterium]|nr:acid phosphatase [Sphingomonadales bacterium]MDE2171076.1 acid phosphatase [Sphingomonadales bacterium]
MTDHSDDQNDKAPLNADRRAVLSGLAAVLGAATVEGSAQAASSRHTAAPAAPTNPDIDAALRDKIETVVVIFCENRSFNNLFADFPGLQLPLSAIDPASAIQRDRDGTPLKTLPPIWEGMVPDKQVVEHREFEITEKDITGLANAPFALKTPEGDPLPHGVVTRDLIHAFYNNQLQINGGKNDGFVAWGDSGALVMGHYGETSAKLRLWSIARDYVLCDNFFMGAFGGSFLNHQYLVTARAPFYPNADKSPVKDSITVIDPADPKGLRPMQRENSPASAMEGPVKFVANVLTPDFYAVNTMGPPYSPAWTYDEDKPGYADATSPGTLVPQTHKTIGDMLSDKGVDWAWYSGGWATALAGNYTPDFLGRPCFQYHHQPLNYFAQFGPGTPAREHHLRDGGEGESPRTNKLLADIAAGKLPPVTFYKPQGNLNMHAGYSDVEAGDQHVAVVVDALRRGPQWNKMMVVITFDENGGWWDHVAPPKGDRWGPGTRVPAVIVSPHAKKGTVDHTIYDTGSILRFITRRWGLEKLPGLKEREDAMMAANGVMPGDLTAALNLV